MRYFLMLLDSQGCGIPSTVLRSYEARPRSRGLEFRWHSFQEAAALTAWDDDYGDPLVIGLGDSVAAGVVRLDNREELKRWLGHYNESASDLELVLRLVARDGTKYIPKILGDFAFVVWNSTSRTAVAACDAFSVYKLFYTQANGLFAFASRGEAIALDDRYEVQYLAELASTCDLSPGLSVYAGVRLVPDGSLVVLDRGKPSTQRYWSAYDVEAEPYRATTEREAAEQCRDLLSESVRLRLGANGDTWAHLSGGMDSSSVVSTVQWLAERGAIAHGLGGAVTFVDRQGSESDERVYSDAVANRWKLRNETIVDPPLWVDDEVPPPATDQPRLNYPFYPRDRRLCEIVRRAGGRVLLTGIGGDELFTGHMYFFADWVARGRAWPALREVAQRAAIGRVSFWTLMYENVVLPLLPEYARNRLMRGGRAFPAWIWGAVAQRYGLRGRAYSAAVYQGRIGRKYQHAVLRGVAGLARGTDPGVAGEALDIRHPFLYRPLVEFAARLPPELCVRPYQRKWVLREAMRGILPDAVRTRVGKGSPVERFAWSLATLRPLLEPLVQEPILADLGVVDAVRLRDAFDATPREPFNLQHLHTAVYTTLAIEAWLQVRSGRWPRGGYRSVKMNTAVGLLPSA
jgi:asparagine synthase (glutamine-hydrolysing)